MAWEEVVELQSGQKKFHVRSNGQFCFTLNNIENHNRDTMNIEGIESQNEYK